MNTFPLFSINAHRVKIKDWSEKHRDRIIDLVSEEQKPVNTLSRIYYSDYHLDKQPPYYHELIEVLRPYIEDFLKENKLNYIATLWCQKYKSGDCHSPHDHGPIGFSAILYAKMDPDVHPSTEFFSPFPTEKGYKTNISLKVEEGDLIIFPAHLLHMAPPHYSDKMRVIFSFNLR